MKFKFDLSSSSPLVQSVSSKNIPQAHGFVNANTDVESTGTKAAKNNRERILSSISSAPGKNLFMNAFMLWMVGSQINMFSIMITGMTCFTAFKTIFSVNQAFEKMGDEGDLLMHKLKYVGLSSVGVAMAGWKLNSMGLLPIKSSDWMSLIQVHQSADVSGISTFSSYF